MILVSRHILRKLTDKHKDAEQYVGAWVLEVIRECWQTPHDLKQRYPKASIVKNKNVIFNICGNRYRIWVRVDYKNNIVLIKNAGTHKEYDKWDIK